MRPKTKHREVIAKVTNARMDRWKEDQFITRLRVDPFWDIFFKLANIYTELGEPFVTINPTTQERSLNFRPYPERQGRQGQRVQAPLLAMDHSAFIKGRQLAEGAAQRIVASWAKAGRGGLSRVHQVILERLCPPD
jgi:hypothetical protein